MSLELNHGPPKYEARAMLISFTWKDYGRYKKYSNRDSRLPSQELTLGPTEHESKLHYPHHEVWWNALKWSLATKWNTADDKTTHLHFSSFVDSEVCNPKADIMRPSHKVTNYPETKNCDCKFNPDWTGKLIVVCRNPKGVLCDLLSLLAVCLSNLNDDS
jgi:hypothetical protein